MLTAITAKNLHEYEHATSLTNVEILVPFSSTALKRLEGEVAISADFDAPNLETAVCLIFAGEAFDAPKLRRVHMLNLNSPATLPELAVVQYLHCFAPLVAPKLSAVPVRLKIVATYLTEWSAEFSALTEVGEVEINGSLSLPICKRIGGLEMQEGSNGEFPELVEIEGGLLLWPEVKLYAPKLTTLRGETFASPEVANALLAQVAQAALATPAALCMSVWHTCDTVHCIAGWGIHLTGATAYALEDRIGASSTGALLLGLEAATHFHANLDVATEWLRTKLPEGAHDATA